MKKIVLLLTVTMCLTLAGCWDSVETEKLGVVTLFGIQLSGKNNIKVTIQEVSPRSPGSGNQSSTTSGRPFNVYSDEGATISEVIQKISLSEHQRIYFAHTKVIILDEELVKSKGIKPVIDFYNRTPSMRLRTWILISKGGQIDKILNANTGINMDTGLFLEETITNEKDNSYLTVRNMKDFIEMVNKPGSEAYTSGISIAPKSSNDKPGETKLNIMDTAIFKNEKMVGWFNKDESRGLSFASGNLEGGFMTIPFDDDVISLRIIKVTSKIEAIIDNGKTQINLKLDVMSNISESHSETNFMNEDTLKKVQQLQSERIKNEITKAVDRSKSVGSDVFGFGDYFNMNYSEFWKKVQNDWNTYYPSLRVNVDVNCTVRNIGSNYETLR